MDGMYSIDGFCVCWRKFFDCCWFIIHNHESRWPGGFLPFFPNQLPVAFLEMVSFFTNRFGHTHRIYLWYIYLHLVDVYGKCRQIYHTWILWDLWTWQSKHTHTYVRTHVMSHIRSPLPLCSALGLGSGPWVSETGLTSIFVQFLKIWTHAHTKNNVNWQENPHFCLDTSYPFAQQNVNPLWTTARHRSIFNGQCLAARDLWEVHPRLDTEAVGHQPVSHG